MVESIQDLSALSKINRSNNAHEMLIKSIKQENTSPLKNYTPRILRNDITSTNRRRRHHPKLKVINQLSPNDSGANPLSNSLKNNTIEKTANESVSESNLSSEGIIYKLIDCHTDDSAIESKFQLGNNSNSNMIKINQHSMLGSDTKFISVENVSTNKESNDAGITARKTAKKIVFLIPAELEGTVEIMKVQSVVSMNTDVVKNSNLFEKDKLFSGVITLPIVSNSFSLATDVNSNYIGPIKNKRKKKRKKRMTPYARHNTKENHRNPIVTSADTQVSTSKASTFEIPESYRPQNYEQACSSVGPIRSNRMFRNHNNMHKQTVPLRSSSNLMYNDVYMYENHCNVPTAETNCQFTQHPVDPYVINRANSIKPYSKPKFRKIKLCWKCRSDSHLSRQCPLT